MPVIVAAMDPVTRIEGHLKVEIEVDTVGGVQQVTGVHTVGTLFRGFEKVLEGRDPRDRGGRGAGIEKADLGRSWRGLCPGGRRNGRDGPQRRKEVPPLHVRPRSRNAPTRPA